MARRSERLKLRNSGSSGASVALADNSERVYAALSSGALSFLALRDVVAVLSSCRLLRNDAALAVAALSNTHAGCHFLHKCAADWMLVPPPNAPKKLYEDLFFGDCSSSRECKKMRATTGAPLVDPDPDQDQNPNQDPDEDPDEDLNRDTVQDLTGARGFASAVRSRRERARGDSEMNRALLSDPRIGRDGAYAAHLLSLVGMAQTHLLPLCYAFSRLNKFGDICAARPVLLPLTRVGVNGSSGASETSSCATADWTRADVKRALNAEWNLLGDEFTSTSAEFVLVSEVGAHWENIAVGRRHGRASCGFCNAARKCVREYKREASTMLKRFNEVLGTKKRKWCAEGFDAEEIHQKRSELKAKFFPEDSYPDVNFADSHDDDVLADICESDRFPMNPFAGMAAGFDRANDDVFNALSEQYMQLCESLYRPLKKVLTEHLAFVGQRVHRTWMDDDDGSVTSELVAGVSTGGVLCGVFVTVKRADYEIPRSAALDDD